MWTMNPMVVGRDALCQPILMPLMPLKEESSVILLDPAGRIFDQSYAEELAQEEELIFICGH